MRTSVVKWCWAAFRAMVAPHSMPADRLRPSPGTSRMKSSRGGLALALGLAGAINHLLFGIAARDPITWILIAAVLMIAALLASFIPALRAARVNPMTSLRSE